MRGKRQELIPVALLQLTLTIKMYKTTLYLLSPPPLSKQVKKQTGL